MNRSDRGFTLGELLAVIAVVAILGGLAIPLFLRTVQTYRLEGAAQKIAGDLRYAQSLAIAQGVLYRLHSGDDPPGTEPGRYRLEQSTNGGTSWNAVTVWYALSSEFQGAGIASIRDSAGIPVTVYEVRFNSRGVCVNPGAVTYPINIVTSAEAGTRTIQVTRTGNLRIL
ncbi:MAG: GspH/FimT family pseudopilin [candidate division NC10 bacterium]|nr:GspH/FimT family pseudopilin [candidate division NC10 bacterium]